MKVPSSSFHHTQNNSPVKQIEKKLEQTHLTNPTKEDNLRTMKEIVEVAVGLPVFKTFHYRIPEKMKGSLQPGMRVLVPFKGRKVTGFTLDLLDQPPKGVEEKLRDVEDLLDEVPLIDSQTCFYRWVSDYYIYPLGEVIRRSTQGLS
jgi:primosomal protein N'